MKSKNNQYVIAFIVLTVLSIACGGQVDIFDTPVPSNVETLVAGTLAVYTENAPDVAFTNIPTMTPSAVTTSTQASFGEIYVYTVVENANLRTNPGLLFSVSRVMPKNTHLLLLGQSRGGEWLNVRNDEGIIGWVSGNVVLMAYDGPPPPIVEPTDVYLITGIVLTELGTPVSGIGYAIIQNEKRTDTQTDETGRFYVYLPRSVSGVWRVTYVSISCTSNTMNADCNCISGICGNSFPENVFVELPQSKDLIFVWK